MGRIKKIIIAVVVVVIAVAAFAGVRYYEHKHAEKTLIGYWQQDNPMETFRQTVGPDQSDNADPTSSNDAKLSGQTSTKASNKKEQTVDIPITIPGLDEDFKKEISLDTVLHFEKGGLLTIGIAGHKSSGRWVLSKTRWNRATVIARVMQTPTFQQRLIMHIRFKGPDHIMITDESGVEGQFHRIHKESSTE